ncbi:MAG: nucleotide sugar dehydrogenase, partial [Nitrospina sp.]|nr:nucleotide sugar dehydrogenase [Nitrospina sp.]
RLLEEKACLKITDPYALDNARKDLQLNEGKKEFIEDPYEAVEGVHAIALITEWSSYKKLDYQKIFEKMEKPAFIFDGRNCLDHQALYKIGFNVYPVGKPELSHL